MADGGGAKRLKSAEDGSVVESEDNGQEEGNHVVLPVSFSAKVDLSRVDSDIVSNVTSFLGTPRELLDLALTCKSFGWRQPMSARTWSLVEEVARQAVCSRATDDEIGCLPQLAR
ncbi:hypothetical protein THAOC_27656, partial [Thalassiosira oceanica]